MIRVAVFLGLVAMLAGCSTPYPPYRVSSLIEDPSLIGAWRLVEEGADDGQAGKGEAAEHEGEDEGRGRLVQFEGRPVAVREGRLERGRPEAGAFGAAGHHVVQYTVRYTEDGKEQVFAGYLLKVGEVELLALQYDGEELGEMGTLVLPVHQYFKFEHEKDEIELRGANQGVVWLPQFEPVDGPEDPDAPIRLRDAPGGTLRVSSSVDRVLAYYAAHGGDEGFWSEKPVVLTRIAEEGEEEEKD